MTSVIDAATQEERPSMLVGYWRDLTVRRSRSDKELGAMPRLSGRGRDRAATWDALVRGKGGGVLDRCRQQVKGVLCMRLDQLEMRKGVLVGLDVVAVLHLVEAVCRGLMLDVIAVGQGGSDGTLIGARVQVDRQQRVHSSGQGDQRFPDIAGRRDRGKLGSDIRGRQPVDVAVGSGARDVSVIGRIEPLLPLAKSDFPEFGPIRGPQSVRCGYD